MTEVRGDMLKSLGKHISYQRRQLGITQEKLAELTGLSRQTIVRIEKGFTHPQELTITIIIEALQSKGMSKESADALWSAYNGPQQKVGQRAAHQMLDAVAHSTRTSDIDELVDKDKEFKQQYPDVVERIPEAFSVYRLLASIAEDIRHHQYPAFAYDFHGHLWLANRATACLIQNDISQMQKIGASGRTTLELVFDRSGKGVGHMIANHREFELEQVLWWQKWNRGRQQQPFYTTLLQRLSETLEPKDSRRFQHRWDDVTEANAELKHDYPDHPTNEGSWWGRVDLRLDGDSDAFIFHAMDARPLTSPDLLNVTYYTPAPPESNRRRCADYFEQYAHENPTCTTLWDLVGIDAIELLERILDAYRDGKEPDPWPVTNR